MHSQRWLASNYDNDEEKEQFLLEMILCKKNEFSKYDRNQIIYTKQINAKSNIQTWQKSDHLNQMIKCKYKRDRNQII